MKHGDLITYREHLVKDYGMDFVLQLENSRFETVKHDSEWYHKMIDHYRERMKSYEA